MDRSTRAARLPLLLLVGALVLAATVVGAVSLTTSPAHAQERTSSSEDSGGSDSSGGEDSGSEGEGSGEDGLLGASEIARLRLDADLVILSACNTAAGLDGQAPVYSGLATAFAQAGARSLMLSHWRVRDDAAARLTVGTVEGMAAGLDRPEALRRAQLSLMGDSDVAGAAHPAIWAPFVIIEN